ncbi:MAG: hypothetical protein AAF985_24315 [Bacteroidota bacterium]
MFFFLHVHPSKQQSLQLFPLLFSFCLLMAACRPHSHSQSALSFYHWKSEFAPSPGEWTYLKHLEIERLYLRLFDIDWDFVQQQAVPLAPLQTTVPLPASMTIVPTLFITNRTFIQLPESQLTSLVDKVEKKIRFHLDAFPNNRVEEIQMDCDWTVKTKSIYFDFLTALQARFVGIPLSATIRLHQVKYFTQTGIPPVARGTLMLYNMGEVDQWESKNSILDLDIAQSYLTSLSNYSLSLDLALPLFSWAVLFREGRMIRLINGVKPEQLKDTDRFHKIDQNRFEVIKSTYLQGQYLYRGDAIRVESIAYDELQKAVQLLRAKWSPSNRHLIFYHLDSNIIKSYPYENLQQLLQSFSN